MTATVASDTRSTMARVTVVFPDPVPPAMPMNTGLTPCASRPDEPFGAAPRGTPPQPSRAATHDRLPKKRRGNHLERRRRGQADDRPARQDAARSLPGTDKYVST